VVFGTPMVDNSGATWAYLMVPVLETSGSITGHLQVSTDPNFADNVITTPDVTIDSNNNEIWQMVNKLQPKTTYYWRGVINVNGQTQYSASSQLTTPAVGSHLAVAFDEVSSQLSWKATQIGSPDPTYDASAYISW